MFTKEMLTAAILIKLKFRDNENELSRMDKLWYIQTMEYYIEIRRIKHCFL